MMAGQKGAGSDVDFMIVSDRTGIQTGSAAAAMDLWGECIVHKVAHRRFREKHPTYYRGRFAERIDFTRFSGAAGSEPLSARFAIRSVALYDARYRRQFRQHHRCTRKRQRAQRPRRP
jgi:hypothetical protein